MDTVVHAPTCIWKFMQAVIRRRSCTIYMCTTHAIYIFVYVYVVTYIRGYTIRLVLLHTRESIRLLRSISIYAY